MRDSPASFPQLIKIWPYDAILDCDPELQASLPGGGGGGGTPLYKVYRYVPPQRVWFLSRFGLKTGINFDKRSRDRYNVELQFKGYYISAGQTSLLQV